VPAVEGPLIDATQIPVAVERPAPTRLEIPSVGISMPVQATGVAVDGQMELPADPEVMGWYRFGPLPGDSTGSAVLGGHVDSIEYGVGPLARLAAVQPGAEVVVTGADGQPTRYQVRSVERIYKAALPVESLFAVEGPHQLAVVTCGGRFLGNGQGYEDNVVVIAVPTPGATP
jgi:sortase (surface protein transpeptidase)